MGDYHDLYLKTDVVLLADVFEKFISTCFEYYGLDPCHYFGSPGLSWDGMLKMTDNFQIVLIIRCIKVKMSFRNKNYIKFMSRYVRS